MYEYTVGNEKLNSQVGVQEIDASYAMRDIKFGEELVTAYDEFDTYNYEAFGLM